MTKKSKYINKLSESQKAHQKAMNQIVLNSIKEKEGLVEKLYQEDENIKRTFGEIVADKIASFGGSWSFIFLFFFTLVSWMFFNVNFKNHSFDPYPFILLNLCLSCLAAIQAPVILMSQNRKSAKEQKRAEDDYLIDLKSELENRAINKKLDLLINDQFKELVEIQKIQIHKLELLESIVKKISSQNKNTA